MYYAPHTLEKRVFMEERDAYGRIVSADEGHYERIAACRCDDNAVQEFSTENGHIYRPKYHVVAGGHVDVAAGDDIRCLNADGSLRAEGIVYNVKHLNVLDYTDIWV